MLDDLSEVAHIDQGAAEWAIAEMVQLGLGDAVNVAAGMARDVGHCRSPDDYRILKRGALGIVLL
jgi:hypothetical protein